MTSNLTLNLTAREQELLKAVGSYLQTASVDWAKTAEKCNYKTPKAARDKWYPLRDKLFDAMTSDLTLTAREQELLKAVGAYLQTASVDWANAAEKCNYKTPKAARDKWYPLRDKLFGASGDSNDAPKAKAMSRKRKAASGQTTPKKKAKKAKKAAA
ncbi:Hypothetical predicted protein [Lecanosticta acicola]|uniref:Myb-like domain-containing protein n=1 Tax=Lecanosticta acicola TaxID=111012 RepID=A0AAI8YVU5_9PEZI|nr:Hypothetical predicted protein [Lecanosticta acicola]